MFELPVLSVVQLISKPLLLRLLCVKAEVILMPPLKMISFASRGNSWYPPIPDGAYCDAIPISVIGAAGISVPIKGCPFRKYRIPFSPLAEKLCVPCVKLLPPLLINTLSICTSSDSVFSSICNGVIICGLMLYPVP